jgi:hypothetical protein
MQDTTAITKKAEPQVKSKLAIQFGTGMAENF